LAFVSDPDTASLDTSFPRGLEEVGDRANELERNRVLEWRRALVGSFKDLDLGGQFGETLEIKGKADTLDPIDKGSIGW